MSGIILPPFIGTPEEAPASSSGLLVYDESWVREPRLMVPRQRPIGRVRISPYSRLAGANGGGLVDLVGLTNLSKLTKPSTTVVGTALQVRGGNLARGFGSTLGVGSTDRVTVTMPLMAFSDVATFYIRFLHLGSFSTYPIVFNFPDIDIRFYLDVSAVTTFWTASGANIWNLFDTPSANIWHTVVFSLNFKDAADIYVYLDGIKKTPLSTPSGDKSSTYGITSWHLGNSVGSDRVCDSLLSEVGIFTGIRLNEAECEELSRDPYINMVPA